MSRGAVHQVLATLSYGDAIGHEVLGIQRVLRSAGYESEIFVETADERLESHTHDFRDLLEASRPENLLLHHFSIGSRASRVAFALPDRMTLVYHNITPPEYFVGVHEQLVRLCYHGRRELEAYVDRVVLALGDSEYNRQELDATGFRRTGVLPVVPSFSHLEVPAHRFFTSRFDDDWTNVIFVGRVIPNKKFEDVITAFAAYQARFNPRSRLIFVGGYSAFEHYFAMLQDVVRRLGVREVHFLGHVTNEELVSVYELADVFLCASEHEGFCVPIVEAFHMGVPVVAFAATAVPATMDGAGVLYHTKDPVHIAALVDAVAGDAHLASRIVAGQDAALARLEARDFGRLLLDFVDRSFAVDPPPVPSVSFDFWHQYEQRERLDEIRQYRPSLYQALPFAPAVTSDPHA